MHKVQWSAKAGEQYWREERRKDNLVQTRAHAPVIASRDQQESLFKKFFEENRTL